MHEREIASHSQHTYAHICHMPHTPTYTYHTHTTAQHPPTSPYTRRTHHTSTPAEAVLENNSAISWRLTCKDPSKSSLKDTGHKLCSSVLIYSASLQVKVPLLRPLLFWKNEPKHTWTSEKCFMAFLVVLRWETILRKQLPKRSPHSLCVTTLGCAYSGKKQHN